jgi:glucan phosphoethanolaminetransferase (alkaline phosphatase superfamily)
MGGGFQHLNKKEYSLKTYDISKDNKWSTFRDDKNGNFFIHSGEKKPSRGIFTFKQDAEIIMNFTIRKSGKSGKIEFTTLHNKKYTSKNIVTLKKGAIVNFKVKKGDTIQVVADKYKSTGQDHGNLEIKINNQNIFNKYIIPFLFSLLFIYLIGKKHTNIAMNSYIIFILILFAEKLNFGVLNFDNILTYAILIFSMTFLFSFIYQELAIAKKFKIATMFSYITAMTIYAIPLVFIIYALNFDTKVTKDILYAIFQSNSSESYEYISDFIHYKYILLFIFITSFIGFLLYKQESEKSEKIERSLLLFTIIIFSSIFISQFSNLRLPKFVISGFEKYSNELKLFRDVQSKRKTGDIKFNASKKNKGETYIIVIGESQNKKHMGLYGYFRDTTPLLDQINKEGEMIVFNNTYSNHTHTVPVLKLSLTQANQYNKMKYYDSLSIIEILKKADIETHWLTNQTIYGAWDNIVSVIATSSDNLVRLNTSIGKQTRTQKYDGALIDEVKKVLSKKTKKNRVIFVHLIGNHGSYKSRYPKPKYSKFNGNLKLGEFGTKASKNANINHYDNSILYNDYVVSSILREFQNEKSTGGFLYMSDHTDDVIGKLGHNSGKFTYHMAQIPFFAWFNNGYKNQYKNKYNNLKNRTNLLYSNDMLYDTMIGMFGVTTDKYNSKYDFTSSDYELKDKDALILHGRKKYIDKSNYVYWQKNNAKYLVDTNQSSRIFPHRVNSIGKLKDVWNDGFRSFEVDVEFGNNDKMVFQMGHNKGVMGVSLEDFLNRVDNSKIEKIWLDFKNLTNKNYKEALKRLEYLDTKYNIKSKSIVESGTKSDFFYEFSQKGWHTSYYMPTGTIVKLLKDRDNTKMIKLAKKISKQVKSQNLSAVSYDHRLYPFVKKYLEAKISKDIVYHIWYSPPLSDENFKTKLLKNKLYLDKRVKTLLGTYKSQFNL